MLRVDERLGSTSSQQSWSILNPELKRLTNLMLTRIKTIMPVRLFCITPKQIRLLFIAIRLVLSVHPLGNVGDEPPCRPRFHPVLNKKLRILIFVNLLEVEAILESHVAGFPDILPRGLTAHPRLMPDSIFFDSCIKMPRNINWIRLPRS